MRTVSNSYTLIERKNKSHLGLYQWRSRLDKALTVARWSSATSSGLRSCLGSRFSDILLVLVFRLPIGISLVEIDPGCRGSGAGGRRMSRRGLRGLISGSRQARLFRKAF